MADLGNFRGYAAVHVIEASGNRLFSLTTENVNPAVLPGNLATWTGDPGDSLTLRLERLDQTAPVNQAPTDFSAQIRVPGGAIIGAAWTGAIPASGDANAITRTFHFDSDPLSQVLDALRSGMVELYLQVSSVGGVQPWNADSRGVNAGLLGGTTVDHAEGRLKSFVVVSSSLVTRNSTPGTGSEPVDIWSWGDPVSARVVFSAQLYESATTALSIRDGAATLRTSSPSGTSVNRDATFDDASGVAAQILSDFDVDADDLRIAISSSQFGGDEKYTFKSSGHEAGWTVISELILQDDGRINIDPVNTVLAHAQGNDTFDAAANDQIYAIGVDQLFSWGRDLFNSRSEPLVGRTLTRRLKRGASLITSDSAEVTNAGGDSTNPADWTAFVITPPGNRTQEIEHDGRNLGVGTLDFNSQVLSFGSPTSLEWSMEVSDKVAPGAVFTVQTYLLVATETGFLLESVDPPTIKLSHVVDPGGRTEDIAETLMTEIGTTDTFTVDLTAPVAGEYILELRGMGQVRTQRLSVGAEAPHTHTHASTTGQTPDDHHAEVHTLDSHSDVTVPAPVEGDAVIFDSASGEWINGDPDCCEDQTGDGNVGPP